jgi:hypothetical protein
MLEFIKFSETAEHQYRQGMEKLREKEYFTDSPRQTNALFHQNIQGKHSAQTVEGRQE